jgi:hypothetical protein
VHATPLAGLPNGAAGDLVPNGRHQLHLLWMNKADGNGHTSESKQQPTYWGEARQHGVTTSRVKPCEGEALVPGRSVHREAADPASVPSSTSWGDVVVDSSDAEPDVRQQGRYDGRAQVLFVASLLLH